MGGPPASSEPSPRPRRPGEATLRLTLASRATLRPAKSPTTRAVLAPAPQTRCEPSLLTRPVRSAPSTGPARRRAGVRACGRCAPRVDTLRCSVRPPVRELPAPPKARSSRGPSGSEGARPPIPGRPSTPSPRWELGSLRIQGGVGTAGPEADAGPMAAGPVPHDRRDEACVRSLAALTPFDFLGPCGAWAGFSSRAPRRRRLLAV